MNTQLTLYTTDMIDRVADNVHRMCSPEQGLHEAGFVISRDLLARAISRGCLESRRSVPQLDYLGWNDYWALDVRPLAMGEFAIRCYAKVCS